MDQEHGRRWSDLTPGSPEAVGTIPPPWRQPPEGPIDGRPGRRRRWVAVVAAVVIAGLVASGTTYVVTRPDQGARPTGAADVDIPQVRASAPPSSTAEMIEAVLPSVVNVRVTSVSVGPFGQPQTGRSEGSGVVLTNDGVIVTNAHVVSGASSVRVYFTNGRRPLDGTVLGVDTTHDLAVIRVDADDLDPITVGRSSALDLGDPVFAIGFPLGLGPTVTGGIVSGLNRTIDVNGPSGREHLTGLLQTDAAINPGNSGGALVNASGQLIGINTAAAQAAAAENVGFSIAIDSAVPIIEELSSQAPSRRAWLGVQTLSVDSDTAALALDLPPDTRGAVVVATVPGSPAAEAGIQPNEVIVSIDGRRLSSDADLSSILADHRPGDEIELELGSTNGARTVSVTLGQRPAGI